MHGINLGHHIELQNTSILTIKSIYVDCVIREVNVIELHPNNMNMEDGFCLNKSWKPPICSLREHRKPHFVMGLSTRPYTVLFRAPLAAVIPPYSAFSHCSLFCHLCYDFCLSFSFFSLRTLHPLLLCIIPSILYLQPHCLSYNRSLKVTVKGLVQAYPLSIHLFIHCLSSTHIRTLLLFLLPLSASVLALHSPLLSSFPQTS
jgi:hypothetical protein